MIRQAVESYETWQPGGIRGDRDADCARASGRRKIQPISSVQIELAHNPDTMPSAAPATTSIG